jgi:HEAT repeat protein
VPALLAVLADPPEDTHSQAPGVASALAKIGDERAIGPLLEAVHEAQGDERARMVNAVGQWDHPAIKPMLIAELNGDDRLAMCAAAAALHKLGDRRGPDRLLALLAGDLAGWDRHERTRVYSTIGMMKDRRAVPGLVAAMRTDPDHAHFLADLLGRLTGIDLPGDSEMWWKWWRQNQGVGNRQ